MRKGFAFVTAAATVGAVVAAFVGAGARPAAAAGPSLDPFGTCEGFLRYVRGNALRLVGPYGLDAGGTGGVPLPVAAETAEAAVDEAAAPEQDAASADFSTTNVQEAGVDEPDIVKTDGSRIFALAAGTLYAVDVGGAGPRLVGSLPLASESGADQLFLRGDRLLVLSHAPYAIFEDVATEIAPSQPLSTDLTEIDVSDPASMRVTGTLEIEGNLVAARLVGSTARVVVSSGPTGLEFVYPDGTFTSDRDAERENRQVIAASGVANWVPSYRLEEYETGSVEERRAVDCREIGRPSRFSGLGLLTVLTFDLERGLEPVDSDAVLAGGETVYASASALYVATQRWLAPGGSVVPTGVKTEIHRFDASSAGKTEYRSSGSVPGFLIGQFAMSEHEGFLRVASTEEPPWWEGAGSAGESRVTVLAERGELLDQIGAVTGLGKGERIYAVRFMGDLGCVVTFRQVDPLYTIDLSDPADPRVAGELKITGYSSYLHPVSDGLLLGIGQDATLEGQVLGTQVSLFDVSDPAGPTLLVRRSLATGWSEAEYDHHAFLYWAKTGLAVLPIQGSRIDPQTGLLVDTGGAVGLRVGTRTLDPIGLVEHPGGQIRRSLVVGDVLYTVSDGGVKASDLATLADEGWVPFA
jgi:uncharacterized secreted protein with C-terminal beta-propeller domain